MATKTQKRLGTKSSRTPIARAAEVSPKKPVAPSTDALLRQLRGEVFKALGSRRERFRLTEVVVQAMNDIDTIAEALDGVDNDPKRQAAVLSLIGIRDRLVLATLLDDGLFDPDRPDSTVLPTFGTPVEVSP